MQTVEDLSDRIKSAFGTTVHPGAERVVVPGMACDSERADVAAEFSHRMWTSFTFSEVDALRWTISFLSDEGYRYYLPMFLLASLKRHGDSVLDSVLYSLRPPLWRALSLEEWTERMRGFSVDQQKAILEFLRWCTTLRDDAVGRDASAAIGSFWGDPETGLRLTEP